MSQTLQPWLPDTSSQLSELAALARRLGGLPELTARDASEARFGPLMRALPEDSPQAPALVAWAVDVNDRNDWRPPQPRGAAVALARLWTSRARWQRPFAALALVLALGLVSILGLRSFEAFRTERAAQAETRQLQTLGRELQDLRDFAAEFATPHPRVQAPMQESAREFAEALQRTDQALRSGASSAQVTDALAGAKSARRRLGAWHSASAALTGMDASDWPEQFAATRAVFDARIDAALANNDVEGVRTAADTTRAFAAWLPQLAARPQPTEADAEARSALSAARQRTDSAVAAGTLAQAREALAQEQALAEFIARSLDLRIVDRAGAQSGVWRYTEGARDARDYYLLVEAFDAGGAVVSVPIQSEETQRTRQVERFGVRVPETIYERYRSEKIARGRIDQRSVGRKPAGALSLQFDLPSAGGYITEW